MFEEIKVNSIEEIVFFINKIDASPRNIIYRGQANKDWILQPSVYRRFHRYEAVILEAFLIYILDIKNIRKPGVFTNSPMEFLAMCQHYGVPTRLLDWSYSLWNSLFFACEERKGSNGKTIEEDGILFVFHKNELTNYSDGDFRTITNEVKIVELNYLNPRINSQQGCFLLWGQIGLKQSIEGTYSFEDYLKQKQKTSILKKIIIPFNKKKELMQELMKHGIDENTLYINNQYSQEIENSYKNFRKISAAICYELTKLEEEKTLFNNSFWLNLRGLRNLRSLPKEPGPFQNFIPFLMNSNKDLVGRNDSCVCRSGKKYKNCCGKK